MLMSQQMGDITQLVGEDPDKSHSRIPFSCPEIWFHVCSSLPQVKFGVASDDHG